MPTPVPPMDLTDGVDAVITIFDGLPADLLLAITVVAIIGAAAVFYSRIKKASK